MSTPRAAALEGFLVASNAGLLKPRMHRRLRINQPDADFNNADIWRARYRIGFLEDDPVLVFIGV
jgi:hypothetical protein